MLGITGTTTNQTIVGNLNTNLEHLDNGYLLYYTVMCRKSMEKLREKTSLRSDYLVKNTVKSY